MSKKPTVVYGVCWCEYPDGQTEGKCIHCGRRGKVYKPKGRSVEVQIVEPNLGEHLDE